MAGRNPIEFCGRQHIAVKRDKNMVAQAAPEIPSLDLCHDVYASGAGAGGAGTFHAGLSVLF